MPLPSYRGAPVLDWMPDADGPTLQLRFQQVKHRLATRAGPLREETITADKSGFGLSVVLAQQTDAATVLRNILDVIDGTLATDPVTGLLRLKLVRADFDPETVPRIDASNSSAHRYSPSTWAETVNEIRVKYRRFINTTDARGFVDDIVTDQDLANWQATGDVRNLTLDFPYITDPDIAALVAARRRRALATPLAHYSWTMNRQGHALMPGDVVIADESAFGVADLVLRVTRIDYGTLEEGAIEVDAVEDVFGVTHATYGGPPPGWTEPVVTTTDTSGEGNIPAGAVGIEWGLGFYE